MRNTVTAIRATLAILVISVGVVAVGTLFPKAIFAAEVSVQTAQLLPPGLNTCAPLAVSGFTPFVYENALDSFELTLQDNSYVAIAASVGNENVPFNQIGRFVDSSGQIRIHADIVSTPLHGTLPITITLISAKAGQPVCASSVITSVGSGPVVSLPVPTTPSTPSKPKPPTSPTSTSKPAPAAPVKPATPSTTVSGGKTSTSGSATVGTKVGTGTAGVLKNICSTSNAPRLWGILLFVYAVLVAAVVFGQTRMPAMMRSQEAIAATIVIPFLLLFGLWYFAESCRINAWAPAIATVIALVGLSVAFWDKPKSSGPTQGVINLPSGKN